TLGVGDVAHLRRKPHGTGRFAFELRSRRGPRCRAPDVESAHRELRPRLADRLRGDHADRFADVDQMAASEVAPVASRAQAITRVAGERRTNFHFVEAEELDLVAP